MEELREQLTAKDEEIAQLASGNEETDEVQEDTEVEERGIEGEDPAEDEQEAPEDEPEPEEEEPEPEDLGGGYEEEEVN